MSVTKRNSAPGDAPLLTRGHTAVMAGRQPDLGGLDYFPTPPWAARAGAELILQLDPRARTCWEPATGGGHMAYALEDYFDVVWKSDIHDHNPPGGLGMVMDFLSDEDEGPWPKPDWIVTNPPFILGEAFVRQAMIKARRGVAMLLRLSFLEGGKRFKLLYVDHPLTAVAPFSERVPMVKGRWDPEASSATAYAWFFWTQKYSTRPRAPMVLPIAPGARARLSKAEDLTRFGLVGDAPLLAR